MQHANDNTFQAVRWSDKRRTHLAKQTKNSVLLYTEFWLTPGAPLMYVIASYLGQIEEIINLIVSITKFSIVIGPLCAYL